MDKNIRRGSSAWLLLVHLFHVGTMWKGDAKLLMTSFFAKSSSIDGYKDLLDSKYIEEHVPFNAEIISKTSSIDKGELFSKADKLETSPYAVVNITPKGVKFLINKDEELERIYKTSKPNARFRTTNPKLFLNELKKSRVMTLFKAAGAQVYDNEKSSLLSLYTSLQIDAPTKDGIYFYTLPEFRSFDNAITPSASDRYNSSKCAGILLSKKGAYMIYLAEPGDNKFISFNNLDAEINIQEKIGYYFEDLGFNFNHLKSPKLASKFMGELDIDAVPSSAVDAVVISDGIGMAYKMCVGTKNGKVSDRVDKDKISEISLHPNKLYHGGTVFTNIFVCPNTSMGVSMLNYLISNSGKDYLDDAQKRIAAFNKSFTLKKSMDSYLSFGQMIDENFEGEQDDPVIYLPVFETNTLHALAHRYFENGIERFDTYGILTRPGMVDGIAKAIRKPCVYYNMKNGSRIEIKRSYDYKGNTIGEPREFKPHEAPKKKKAKRHRKLVDLRTDDRAALYSQGLRITGQTLTDVVIQFLDPYFDDVLKKYNQVNKEAIQDMRDRFGKKK